MNILIAGVGGQGSLLASKILGQLYINRGIDVKASEVHGMSQRGGGVITYVRAAKQVAMPLVEEGEADLLIALEALEALRWQSHVRPGGAIAASWQRIPPISVLSGASVYPDVTPASLRDDCKVIVVDAQELAKQAGSTRTANVVMLGAVSPLLDFSEKEWQTALQTLPPKIKEVNEKAFALGRQASV